jgi:hypothetical protein
MMLADRVTGRSSSIALRSIGVSTASGITEKTFAQPAVSSATLAAQRRTASLPAP